MKDPDSKNGNIILAIAFLPPISWFMSVVRARQVSIETHETYPKQTYRNRCLIYSANGALNLTIPVTRPKGNHSQTTDVLIHNDTPWKSQQWRTIESAYNSSPWFLFYKDEIERLFNSNDTEFLFKFNLNLIQTLMDLTGIEKKLSFTSKFENNPSEATDLRWNSNPRIEESRFITPPYTQVFQARHGFLPDLSIIDLLFNLGPETLPYLLETSKYGCE